MGRHNSLRFSKFSRGGIHINPYTKTADNQLFFIFSTKISWFFPASPTWLLYVKRSSTLRAFVWCIQIAQGGPRTMSYWLFSLRLLCLIIVIGQCMPILCSICTTWSHSAKQWRGASLDWLKGSNSQLTMCCYKSGTSCLISLVYQDSKICKNGIRTRVSFCRI